ncbi:MAG: hypothetical protein IJS95_02910 [Prevotella sp.]|nr:hypothetical protein [Prevotella sp.]
MKRIMMLMLLFLPVLAFAANWDGTNVLRVNYYGTDLNVHFTDSKMARVPKDDDKKIKKCITWVEEASAVTLKDCQAIKNEMQLGDWAYVKLIDKVSKAFLQDCNESVIMMASLLSRSGYDVRLAGDGSKRVMLLFCSDAATIGSLKRYDVDGKRYFLYQPSDKDARAKDLLPNQGKPVSMMLQSELKMKDFVADLPDFSYSDGTNREKVLMALPLDEATVRSMKARVGGQSQQNMVRQLTEYVNRDYEAGQRAAMLYRMVRDVAGLQVVQEQYQGRSVVGVCITDDDNVQGEYIVRDGMHYVLCDL